MRKAILLLSVFLFTSLSDVDAQLFRRVLDRAVDKVSNQVEDKIVEGISTEIANRAMKPVDTWFNEVFKKQYEETYGEPYDDSKYENDEERAEAMSKMMGSMFGKVEIADSYTFSHILEAEVYDYGAKKPNKMKMLISNGQDIFGMEQDGKEDQIIVWDFGKDVMVLYNKKEKTAMAMPSFMKLAGQMGVNQAVDKELSSKNMTITKMNKTKKIAGYKCEGYKMTSDEEDGEAYMTKELGFGWSDAYGKMLKDMAPNFYKDNEAFSGEMMLMRSEIVRKKDKKKSKWITKKVRNKNYTIKTKDYKVSNPMTAEAGN